MVIGNSMFIVGGHYNRTIEEYNISTKTLKNVTTMETSLFNFGICAINKNEALIAGGESSDNLDATNKCCFF